MNFLLNLANRSRRASSHYAIQKTYDYLVFLVHRIQVVHTLSYAVPVKFRAVNPPEKRVVHPPDGEAKNAQVSQMELLDSERRRD